MEVAAAVVDGRSNKVKRRVNGIQRMPILLLIAMQIHPVINKCRRFNGIFFRHMMPAYAPKSVCSVDN